jgi:signal transduction histidine kinase
MRSIRRSLTIYLFALLVVTLAVVGLVIDRVTENALSAREADGAALIQAQYEERCREVRKKTDESLLNQARLLYGLMTEHFTNRFPVELTNLRLLNEWTPLMLGTDPLNRAARDNPLTRDQIFRMYFSNLEIPKEYIQQISETSWGSDARFKLTEQVFSTLRSANVPDTVLEKLNALRDREVSQDEFVKELTEALASDEKEHWKNIVLYHAWIDYQQINTGGGSEWHSQSLAVHRLPFVAKEIDAKLAAHGKPADNLVVWVYDDTTLAPGNEAVHRILFKVPQLGFMRRGGSPGGPQAPRSLLGSWSAWAAAGSVGPSPVELALNRPMGPSIENLPRLYIQCARPKASIDAALTQLAEERDDARAKLANSIQDARLDMRLRTFIVALLAILAAAIGGPIIVGAGLRPVGKLSDAVSRVSERDFKLPHDGSNLVRELVPIHSRLTQTLDLLRRAFSREKQAVADISHELRTPIAALMATIDVALRKPRSSEEYRTKLEECREISRQLSQLVERIMKLASLDAGNERTTSSRTDAIELVTSNATIIRPLASANGVSLHLHLPDDLIELDTDADKLREVLTNLLHNAVEYNKKDGRIDFSLRREGDNAVFEVRDTGIGMTPDIKDKIFERFFRADPSRHATGAHAGLGLAIVKEYITRLNGTIDVESEPGNGSTFRITLPAIPGEPNLPFEEAEPMAARS